MTVVLRLHRYMPNPSKKIIFFKSLFYKALFLFEMKKSYDLPLLTTGKSPVSYK